MISQTQIDKKLKEIKPYLKKEFKVKEIGVFGSFARGEQSKKSDIDIIVKFSSPIGWEFVDLKEYLEKKLGKKVDLVTPKALKPQIKKSILDEVIYI